LWDWKQENYHDSLANAANSVRERAGTCSARTRIRFYRIRQGKGIHPRRRRVGNHSSIRQQTRSPPARGDRYEESIVSPTAARAREALALPFIDLTARDSFVDKELAPRAIPERIYARKPCASAYERPPARSLTFGKLFQAAAAASKSCQPKSRGRPQNQGDRRGCEPFWPKPVVAQGQGRVDCRGRVPREHSSPRRHSRG
jgi:hypothetical protein